MREILSNGFHEIDLSVSDLQISSLETFCALLLEKNKVMNLTAIKDPLEVAKLHFLDSAFLLKAADLKNKRLLDIGTGAGFPAVPTAILSPTTKITGMDSTGKRITFLQECCRELDLKNLQLITARAEEAAFREDLRSSFDFVTARAVSALPVLLELAVPYLKKGGLFLCMKGQDIEAELSSAEGAIRKLHVSLIRNMEYTIPGTDTLHRILVFRKDGNTPSSYPRRYAKILKEPL